MSRRNVDRLAALPAVLAAGLVRGYQLLLSPVLPMSCRFYPTCSDYAREAFARHGLARGLGFALWRVARCNPWNRGGLDPVPDAASCGCTGAPITRSDALQASSTQVTLADKP